MAKNKVSQKKLIREVEAFWPRLKQLKNGDSLTFNYSKSFSIAVSKTNVGGYFLLPAGFKDGLLVTSLKETETALNLLLQCYVEGSRSAKPGYPQKPADAPENLRNRTCYIA
jgi:hypothetical protein